MILCVTSSELAVIVDSKLVDRLGKVGGARLERYDSVCDSG